MTRKALAISLAVLCTLTLGANAQTYKIRVKEHPDEGKKVVEKSTQKTTESIKASVMGMVVKDETKIKTKETEVTMHVLEKGAAAPKKFKRTYTKAQEIEDQQQKPLSYHGRTIVFELKGDKYGATVEGQPPLPDADIKKLEDSVNLDLQSPISRLLLPAKEVAVGETWTIDIAKLAKVLAQKVPIDQNKSSAQGKLIKVYQKEGHQFGTMEFDLKMAVNSLGPVKLDNPLPFNMKLTYDAAIDGSTTLGTMQLSGDLKGKADIMQGGQKINFELNISMSGQQSQSAEQ